MLETRVLSFRCCMLKRLLFPIVAGSVVFFAAGCAPSKTPTAGPTPFAPQAETVPTPVAEEKPAKAPVFTADPCELVTSADAVAFLGGPVAPPYTEQSEDPAGKFCRYFTTQESDLSRIIEFKLYESDNLKASLYEWDANEYYSRFKTAHAAARPEGIETIGGVGDDAYYDGSMIRVLKGKYVLQISARGFGSGGEDTDKKNREATINVAKKAVAGLK